MMHTREGRLSMDNEQPTDDQRQADSASSATATTPDEEKQIPKDLPSSESDDDSLDIREQAWGRHGKVLIWIGIALMWTVFELDNATVYNYQNYATSEFEQISLLGALTTAGTIVSAVLKPPIAKISDVAGRAETYSATVVLYIVSYALCASSNGFNQYAGGYIIYCVGQTGMQILNQIIVADITSSRWRGLANGLVNLPFMIIPWISAFIVDSALANVGWRWGIGMFAIILPACAIVVIIPLFFFQRRLSKLGGIVHNRMTVRSFVSQIDLGGMIFLSGGFAMVLLPLAFAGNTPDGWRTPWIPTLLCVGAIFLAILYVYEHKVASKPVIPPRFLRNVSLVLAWLIGLLDSFAFSVTHTYMYAWATVTHSFSARNATFLTYTAGCMQVLTGLITGYLMFRSKRYKWLVLIGVVIRLVGYGIMMRLRGASNATAELFVVQIIQGAGSGIVGTVVIVVAQIVVTRAELAQSTALELLFIYLGNAIGSAVAGSIYTNLFKGRLRVYLGPEVPQSTIDSVYDTITKVVPDPGTPERNAVNRAYSDVLRSMTIAALVASAIPMIMVWFLPNLKLNNKHNLAEAMEQERRNRRESQVERERIARLQETRWQKWKRWTKW